MQMRKKKSLQFRNASGNEKISRQTLILELQLLNFEKNEIDCWKEKLSQVAVFPNFTPS